LRLAGSLIGWPAVEEIYNTRPAQVDMMCPGNEAIPSEQVSLAFRKDLKWGLV